MALTFGEMTEIILNETFRDSTFTDPVEKCIVSAIKELESEKLFINETLVTLPFPSGIDYADVPPDFMSVLQVQLLSDDNGQPGSVVMSASSGFSQITFADMQNYKPMNGNLSGNPVCWALWGDKIYIAPKPQTDYFIRIFYYKRDGYYPENYSDSSIWLGDLTADVTRYMARSIFYKDYLQSPDLAASDYTRCQAALERLRNRNAQRQTLNTLSI